MDDDELGSDEISEVREASAFYLLTAVRNSSVRLHVHTRIEYAHFFSCSPPRRQYSAEGYLV